MGKNWTTFSSLIINAPIGLKFLKKLEKNVLKLLTRLSQKYLGLLSCAVSMQSGE
jgi:hypothetical protein